MKTQLIILLAIGIFLILSIFGSIRSCQVKKLAAEKAKLETEFKALKTEKENLKAQLVVKQVNFNVLQGQKTALEIKLREHTTETNKAIESFKKTIQGLNSISTDTIYLDLFSKWPHFNQVLKFRFAESQIRGMYLNVLERNNYENLYVKTTKSLVTCTDLNSKNNQIIGNLTDQNTNLTTINDLSELQVINLEDNLKLSDKTLNKQKQKTFFYKATTVVAASGCFVLILK